MPAEISALANTILTNPTRVEVTPVSSTANTVKQVLPALESGATVKHAYLGLQTTQSQSGSGARIDDATPGGPAERAGLQAGDVVTKVDGKAITSPADVAAAIADDAPGDKVEVQVQRGGSKQSIEVTLGQRPEQVPSP